MKILVSGGCKNGKSIYGQSLAKGMKKSEEQKLYYLATMIPKGEEDFERIRKHLQEREGWGFHTIEVYKDFYDKLKYMKKGDIVLFDSLTSALENAMFDQDFNLSEKDIMKLEEDLKKILELDIEMVFISDNIYCDGIKYDETTELYRKKLADLDRLVAQGVDRVVEISFNREVIFK